MAGPSAIAPDFVHAVNLSFDVTAEASLRSQANASLDTLRQSEDGWQYCLQAFGAASASQETVAFWCLQSLVDMVVKQNRYVALPDEQRHGLQQALLSWLQSKGAPHTDQPASVKNKFAQLLVRAARAPPRRFFLAGRALGRPRCVRLRCC